MAEDTTLVRDQISETRDHLYSNIRKLETRVNDTIETAKQFTPDYQIQHNPLLVLGGSIAAGVFAGAMLSGNRGAPGGSSFLEPISDEMKTLKRVALIALVEGLGQVASQAMPQHAENLDKIFTGLSSKLKQD